MTRVRLYFQVLEVKWLAAIMDGQKRCWSRPAPPLPDLAHLCSSVVPTPAASMRGPYAKTDTDTVCHLGHPPSVPRRVYLSETPDLFLLPPAIAEGTELHLAHHDLPDACMPLILEMTACALSSARLYHLDMSLNTAAHISPS